MDRKIYLEFEELYKRIWHIQQELKSVSNTQVSHMSKIDSLQSKIDEHTSKIDSHSGSIGSIQTSVSSIGSSVQGLSNSIDALTQGQNMLNQGQVTLKNNINSINMCPNGLHTRIIISSYKGENIKIFTAPKNGFAVIRGDYTGTASYHVNNSFYQWAANEGCPFFALKAGDSLYLENYNGTWNWADLYYVEAQEV